MVPLHAAELQHGTDGFAFEGRHAEDFFRQKNPTSSVEFEPGNLGTRSQHANH
jgi:hypothetical protein